MLKIQYTQNIRWEKLIETSYRKNELMIKRIDCSIYMHVPDTMAWSTGYVCDFQLLTAIFN